MRALPGHALRLVVLCASRSAALVRTMPAMVRATPAAVRAAGLSGEIAPESTAAAPSGEIAPESTAAEIAPESTAAQIAAVSATLSGVLGDEGTASWDARRQAARSAVAGDRGDVAHCTDDELVYGELGVAALATILDAVGVRRGDAFLDVGAGDGALVLGAALLHPASLRASRGVEISRGLVDRSLEHRARVLADAAAGPMAPTELLLGDVHAAAAREAVADSTLAVCFATTWARSSPRRELPRLSEALRVLPAGARVVLVDARFDDPEFFDYGGAFELFCPDTAPSSEARLYTRR